MLTDGSLGELEGGGEFGSRGVGALQPLDDAPLAPAQLRLDVFHRRVDYRKSLLS
jgi:hypothetical protein